MKIQLNLFIIAIAAIATMSCVRQNEIKNIEYEKIECKNDDGFYIRLPQAGQSDALDSVRNYLLEECFFIDDFTSDIQKSIDDYISQMNENFAYESPIDTFLSNNLLIQYKKESLLMKAGIESEGVEYIVFDAKTGRKIEIADVFSDLQLILKEVQQKANELQQTEEFDLECEVYNTEVEYDIYNFYFTNDSIVFNFDISWDSDCGGYSKSKDIACLSKSELKPYVKPKTVLYKYWYQND